MRYGKSTTIRVVIGEVSGVVCTLELNPGEIAHTPSSFRLRMAASANLPLPTRLLSTYAGKIYQNKRVKTCRKMATLPGHCKIKESQVNRKILQTMKRLMVQSRTQYDCDRYR